MSFIAITITRKGGHRITASDIATIGLIIICYIWADHIDLIELPMWSDVFSYAVKNFVLFLKIFNLLFKLLPGLIQLIVRFYPVTQVIPIPFSRMLGWTYLQSRPQSNSTCTFTHEFNTSWLANSSYGLIHTWGYHCCFYCVS